MFCPNCGKEQVDNPKFCRSCGTKLVQETARQPEIRQKVEPDIRQSVQPENRLNIQPSAMQVAISKPRSAALKWGTGLLIALTVYYFIALLITLASLQNGFEAFFFPGDFIWPILALFAVINAVRRKHWGYVRTITILLPIATILGTVLLFAMLEGASISDADVFITVFETVIVLLLEITCAILISRTKVDFS